MLGFDLDGVLASQNLPTLIELDKLKEEDHEKWLSIVMDYFASQVPLLTEHLFNGDKVIIITARDKDFEPLTKFWLDFWYGDNYELFCVGYDKDTKRRKVEIMKKMGIDKFIDDNKKWIEHIRSEGIDGIHWEVEQ